MTIGIKVSYLKEGQLVTEEFHSLFECSCHYQVGFECLKKIIKSQLVLARGTFPTDGVSIELIRRDKNAPKRVRIIGQWHCDICDKDIQINSKSVHLNSKRHAANMTPPPMINVKNTLIQAPSSPVTPQTPSTSPEIYDP